MNITSPSTEITFPCDFAIFQNAENWYFDSSERVGCPFEQSPQDYVAFSETDLAGTDSRSLQNAFHNSKRAIACAIDASLWRLGMAKDIKRPIPHKLEVLKRIGVVSTRIVRKIVSTRNLLEHSYTSVDRTACEDAQDIAALFSKAIDVFASYKYDGFFLDANSTDIEGYFDWVYEDCSESGILKENKRPCGIFFDFYRKLPIDPTSSGGVCQRNCKDRLSADELRARGYEELGHGVVTIEQRDLYMQILQQFVVAINRL